MEKTKTFDPDRSAAIIRGVLGVRREKQTALAKKIGISRGMLNYFLNRKMNLLDTDIAKIFEELDISNEGLLLSATVDTSDEEEGGANEEQ